MTASDYIARMTASDYTARVEAEYRKAPALTPFSRKPIPYSSAVAHGLRSVVEAQRRVQAKEATT